MKRQTIIGGNGTIGKMVAAELHKMNISVRIAQEIPSQLIKMMKYSPWMY
jgi:predicted dinucleotide-binding enzyme